MRKILKWTGIVFGSVMLLLIVAGVLVYPVGARMFSQRYSDLQVEEVPIPSDADAIEHGKHISIIWTCTKCHGRDLSGTLLANDPVLGTIPAPNVTAGEGGIGGSYADLDWVRAIRHGVAPDGTVLALMPDYSTLSDGDLADLIAYLKQLPPVDKEYPELKLGPAIPLAPALGLYTPAAEVMDHSASNPADPVPGASVEYGGYLFQICRECHSKKLAGDLVKWTEQDFNRALHSGILPNGRTLPAAMRSDGFRALTDTELAALWLYLRELAN